MRRTLKAMEDESQREEMNAAIQAQRERGNVPKSMLPPEDEPPVQAPAPADPPAPEPGRRHRSAACSHGCSGAEPVTRTRPRRLPERRMGDCARAQRGLRLKRGLQIAAACVVVLVGAFAVGTAVAGPFFWYSCSLDGLEAHGPSQASILVSRDGTRLGLLGATGVRQPVALQRISPVMRKAIVDTEDRRFYDEQRDRLHRDRAGAEERRLVGRLRAGSFDDRAAARPQPLSQRRSRRSAASSRRAASRSSSTSSGARTASSRPTSTTSTSGRRRTGSRPPPPPTSTSTRRISRSSRPRCSQGCRRRRRRTTLSTGRTLRRRAGRRCYGRCSTQATSSRGRYRKAVHSPLGLHPRPARGLGRPDVPEPTTSPTSSSTSSARNASARAGCGSTRRSTRRCRPRRRSAILGTLDRKNDPAGSVVSIDPKTGQIRAMAIAQTGKKIAYDLPVDGQRQAGSTFKMFVLDRAPSAERSTRTRRSTCPRRSSGRTTGTSTRSRTRTPAGSR